MKFIYWFNAIPRRKMKKLINNRRAGFLLIYLEKAALTAILSKCLWLFSATVTAPLEV